MLTLSGEAMERVEQTLAEQAVEQLFKLIFTGELPLGGEVNEANLARRFNISRGPVREAVQRLQGLRLVTREPYMRARVVSLSRADVVEIFQMREAVEGMACRLATNQMSDEELWSLSQDLEGARFAYMAGKGQEMRPSLDIHVRIAEGCGNNRIKHLLCQEMYYLLRLYRGWSGSTPGRHDRAFDEHRRVVRAMRARNPEQAEMLMRSHINQATQSLLDALEPDESQPSMDGSA